MFTIHHTVVIISIPIITIIIGTGITIGITAGTGITTIGGTKTDGTKTEIMTGMTTIMTGMTETTSGIEDKYIKTISQNITCKNVVFCYLC